MYKVFLILSLCFTTLVFASNDLSSELSTCLKEYYHIEGPSNSFIASKFDPLIKEPESQFVIVDFIQESEKLNIDFSKPFTGKLPSDDPVLKTPEWHDVLFDSPNVRVLMTTTRGGEMEEAHKHHWKRLLVILQGAKFELKYTDGTIELGDWPIGVYDLPADAIAFSALNLSDHPFIALSFEIKE